MPAPSRARQPVPAGRRPPSPGGRPGYPPGNGRSSAPDPRARQPQQLAPRTQRRERHHSRARPVLLGALLLATVLVAGWWFLGRGSGAPGKDFNSVEQRFVTAARTIPNATATVHRFLELDEFDAAVDAQVVVLQRSMREFQTIADGEDGEAAELAQDAVTNGERALRAIERFRAAITVSNDLVVAQKALDDLRAEVDDLESKVDKWNDL